MQVTSYNPHLGLLRSEHCWGEHRTVYSGRREADVVMTSTRHCFRIEELSRRDDPPICTPFRPLKVACQVSLAEDRARCRSGRSASFQPQPDQGRSTPRSKPPNATTDPV